MFQFGHEVGKTPFHASGLPLGSEVSKRDGTNVSSATDRNTSILQGAVHGTRNRQVVQR